MTETAKYCSKCSRRLSSITPKTDKEIEFYRASRFQFEVLDEDRLPLTHFGACDHCGREDLLIYYRIPD